jgi:hypothetical protein
MRSIIRVGIASATGLLLLVAAAPLASASNGPPADHGPQHAALQSPTATPADLTGKNILVYGPAGTGGSEESVPGATYTIWDAATWASATTAQFKAFNAIVFEDPFCGTPDWSTAISNESTWAPAVTGNVFINGTDPNLHGMNLLPQDGVSYAATGSGAGLYVSLSCSSDYASASALLAPFGNFTVQDPGDCGSAVHVVWSDPALADLTDSYLSNWGCSVHEGFTAFPSSYHVFAIDTTSTDPWWTAPDGTQGMPYILVSGSGSPPVPSNVTSINESIKATTPAYKIDLTVGLQNVSCPATLSLTAGSLASRSVPVCASGQTAPSSVHVSQPVFDTSGELPPDSTFAVKASVNGGTTFGTTLATPQAPIWIGVGDSYSSGHHQTADNTLCWLENTLCGVYRNAPSFSWISDGTNSAAALLNARLKPPSDWAMTSDMLAQSGAKAADYGTDGQIAAMQSDIETHSGSWNVVSFTGGGNDANLRGILSNYYHAHPSGKPWAVTSWSKSNCPDADTFYGNAIAAASSIKSALKNIMTTAAASSASTRFVDVEYPNIMSTSNVCAINHSTSTGTWFGSNAAVNYLDNLQKNISAPGLVHIDLRPKFDNSSNVSDLQLIRYFGFPHPNATGQQLIAKLAAAAVK